MAIRGLRTIRSSFFPNPSEVVNPILAPSRLAMPHGATPVTTAPPAGVT
jgi:hypothetical protein